MFAARDIHQFIFINHPYRRMLFRAAGNVLNDGADHARELGRINIGLPQAQRFWRQPVVAPVGLYIAFVQQRQQKTSRGALRQATHFRRLRHAEPGKIFGKKLDQGQSFLQTDYQIARMYCVLHISSHFCNIAIDSLRLSQWWCD